MKPIRGLTALLLVAASLLLTPALAKAQGCDFNVPPSMPLWFSVGAGGGITMPLASESELERLAPGFGGNVGVNFYNGIRLLLDYRYYDLEGSRSLYDFVDGHQLHLKGLFPVIHTTYVDFHIGLIAGVSFITKQFFYQIPNGPENEWHGLLLRGVPLRSRVPSFTGGAAARLTVYPLEALGIFMDVSSGYSLALMESLSMAEGALLLHFSLGTELHF